MWLAVAQGEEKKKLDQISLGRLVEIPFCLLLLLLLLRSQAGTHAGAPAAKLPEKKKAKLKS